MVGSEAYRDTLVEGAIEDVALRVDNHALALNDALVPFGEDEKIVDVEESSDACGDAIIG